MYTLYNFYLFLHIVAAIIWLGGAFMVTITNVRLSQQHDRAGLASLGRQGNFYTRSVFMPAAVISLVTGILLTSTAGISFGALWITWGFTGIIVSIVLGAVLIRRTIEELGRLAAAPASNGARIGTLQQRVLLLSALNLLVLFSVVWGMVFKPTL
jgi:uncharacterized membrane protein